ncbi:MAG: hypothetical protein ACRCSP_04700 [Rhodoglobus sp.]
MRSGGLIAAGIITLLLTGCAGGAAQSEARSTAEPKGLTSKQSERLAITRFRNFDAGTRAVQIMVPQSQLGEIQVTGWYDFANNVGYGAVKGGGLVWWNTDAVAIRDIASSEPVIPLPADGWVRYPLDPSANPLATALALVGSLGVDRPENPQLLAQSDALWLRNDTVKNTAVEVFVGPSADGAATSTPPSERVRYWLDATGMLLLFEAPIGDAWMTAQFSEAKISPLPTTAPGSP